MIVILAHRQMDFDALASMVAAQKIYPGSIMASDSKPNRYVQDFLALAKDQFPFMRFQDIDWAEVERIVLVDTHDLHRAVNKKVIKSLEAIPLEIYDHHPYEGALKPGMHIENIGACTTLLVEKLKSMGIPLSPFEATLFTLGIYDDTGSLSFDSTNVRDVLMVAYLLEAGANLGVVAEYLRKPLTEERRELLQKLLNQGETEFFDGQPVYITAAESKEYIGGLSLLAHRVGEFQGAETLFLVVSMEDRVYIVGRSRGKGLSVNQIVQAFGGAGHSRAASATLKNVPIDEVLVQLKEEISNNAQKPHLVKDIMSCPVKTVGPDMKLSEVEQLLLKYGHTGVTVAQDNKLVGIISRRDVDKAMKHGLGHAPVKGFMTKDVVTLGPYSRWEEAQRLMIQHDIGRVPVIDQGVIIGIISRTDVLRQVHGSVVATEGALIKNRSLAMRQDILELLGGLPQNIGRLMQSVRKIADCLDCNVYVVGGFVRDLLLHFPTHDLDFVVEGDSYAFAKALHESLGSGELVLHEKFGTARIEFPDGAHLDVAKSRWEYYEFPGALPQVEESRLKDDMFRRDFTINAMAIAMNSKHYGELIDYYGGLRDLKQGEIRFLHNLSFIEDPTRILRAVRFAGRYDFHLGLETKEAINTALQSKVLRKLSPERFTEELMNLVKEEHFGTMGIYLDELGVLKEWFKEGLPWDFSHTLLNTDIDFKVKWLLSIRSFEESHYQVLLENLRLTKELKAITQKYLHTVNALASLGSPNLLTLDNYLQESPDWMVDILADNPKFTQLICEYKSALHRIDKRITGADPVRLGIGQGPVIGKVLKATREAWLLGRIHTPNQEKEFVKRYCRENGLELNLE